MPSLDWFIFWWRYSRLQKWNWIFQIRPGCTKYFSDGSNNPFENFELQGIVYCRTVLKFKLEQNLPGFDQCENLNTFVKPKSKLIWKQGYFTTWSNDDWLKKDLGATSIEKIPKISPESRTSPIFTIEVAPYHSHFSRNIIYIQMLFQNNRKMFCCRCITYLGTMSLYRISGIWRTYICLRKGCKDFKNKIGRQTGQESNRRASLHLCQLHRGIWWSIRTLCWIFVYDIFWHFWKSFKVKA